MFTGDWAFVLRHYFKQINSQLLNSGAEHCTKPLNSHPSIRSESNKEGENYLPAFITEKTLTIV